jgi:hypothetical protein
MSGLKQIEPKTGLRDEVATDFAPWVAVWVEGIENQIAIAHELAYPKWSPVTAFVFMTTVSAGLWFGIYQAFGLLLV